MSAELRREVSFSVGEYVSFAAFRPDGRGFALGLGDGRVAVHDADGRPRYRLAAHPTTLLGLAFSSDGRWLATSGPDGARVFSVDDGAQVARVVGDPEERRVWTDHVAFAPRGPLLAVTRGRRLEVHDVGAARRLFRSDPHPSTLAGLQWSSTGDRVAVAAFGGVWVHGVSGAASPRHLAWPGAPVSLAWSPKDAFVASGCQDGTVHFFRLGSGRDAEMSGYRLKPKVLAWDRQGSLLATSGDATVTCWNFSGRGPEGSRPVLLEGHQAPISALAFDPTSDRLASGSEDTGVIVWAPRRSRTAQRFGFLEDAVTALAWAPSGGRLVAADAAGTATIFAVEPP